MHILASGPEQQAVNFGHTSSGCENTAPYPKQTLPILVSEHTPINLLGRDALCKMGIHIKCSPEGAITDKTGLNLQMVMTEGTANVYWLGEI